MKRKPARSTALAPRETTARVIISMLAMLAFGLQSYITQTHIHLKPDTFTSYSKLDHQSGKEDPRDKFPANGDPANCPICQEIAHTGQFVTPSAAVLLLPTAAISIVALATEIIVVPLRASHTWRSRAPPRA